MDNVCRIAVSDENRASMLRAALTLGGIKCGDSGKILVTDGIPSERGNISAIVYITESGDIPDNGIPTVIVRMPICFDEIIEAVSKIREELSKEVPHSDGIKPEPAHEAMQITVRGGCVICDGKTIRLTEQESALFEYLRARSGKIVSRKELRDALWSDAEEGTNVTDVYISYLRRKLKPVFGEGVLLTVRGKGYILKLPE